MLNQKVREELLSALPRRYAKTISKKTGYSENHVYRVLNNYEQHPNERILMEAFDLAETEISRRREMKRRMEKFSKVK